MLGFKILRDRKGWVSKDQVTISDPATVKVSFRHNYMSPPVRACPLTFFSFVSPIRGTSLCLYIFLYCQPLEGHVFSQCI